MVRLKHEISVELELHEYDYIFLRKGEVKADGVSSLIVTA